MKKLFFVTVFTSAVLFMGSTALALPTRIIDLGDDTVEEVQIGYSGDYRKESLEYWFSQNGVTNPDGSAIDPVENQLQHELFYTDADRDYQVEFLGIGYAGYHSPFGVFTYDGDPFEAFDAARLHFDDPLFVQNEVPPGTVYDFRVAAGTYFGFYLNSNNSGNYLTSMIAANLDGLDHALFYETNRGYTISFEDIVGGGDRDYEDLIVNVNPVPEPTTCLLLGIGLIGLGGFCRKIQRDRNQK